MSRYFTFPSHMDNFLPIQLKVGIKNRPVSRIHDTINKIQSIQHQTAHMKFSPTSLQDFLHKPVRPLPDF